VHNDNAYTWRDFGGFQSRAVNSFGSADDKTRLQESGADID